MAVDTTFRFNATDGTVASSATAGFKTGTQVLNGGSMTHSADSADEGSTGLKVVSAAGLVASAKWPIDSPSVVGGDGVGEWTLFDLMFFTEPTSPNVASTLLQLRTTAGGGASVARLLQAAGTNDVYLLGGSGSSALGLLSAAPLGTKFFLTGAFRIDTATTGKISARVLDANRNPVGNAVAATAYNLGTAAVDEFALGVLTALTNSTTHKYDTARFRTGVTGNAVPAFLGAYSPPSATAPTVGAPASQMLQAGSNFTFTPTYSDPSGTLDHYEYRKISGPGPTPPASTTQPFTGTVQSTPGDTLYAVKGVSSTGLASQEKQFYLYAYSAPGVVNPPDDIASNTGAWIAGGTATSLLDGLSGSNTAKSVQSPAGATAAKLRVSLPPVAATDTIITFDVDLVKSDGSTLADVGQTGSMQAQLFAGGTAISQVIDQVVSRTLVTVTIDLTDAQNAAFTAAGRHLGEVEITASAN